MGLAGRSTGRGPYIPLTGTIPWEPEELPREIYYDPAARRRHVGRGFVENVSLEVWAFEVSGKHVVRQWFGDRRNSDLGKIQPGHWLGEYTTELLNLLHVLGRLVQLQPAQADLLTRICAGETIPAADLNAGDADAVAESGAKCAASRLVLNQLSFF